MLRIIIQFSLLHFVISQNADCVPTKMLQKKLCRAVNSGLQVFKMKVQKDLTMSPDDSHRYEMRIIRKMNKLTGKRSRINLQQNDKVSNGNGKKGCRACVIEVPRDCSLEVGTRYIVSASHETPSGVLAAGCDELMEWRALSKFQKERLLGHGYSCNVEICFDDCMNAIGCANNEKPSACRLKREDSDCYDKYAECAPNENSSDGEWSTQASELNSCLLLDSSISDPFLNNPPSNATNVTVSP